MRKYLPTIACILAACSGASDFANPGGLTAEEVSGRHRLVFEPAKSHKGFSISVSSTTGGPTSKSLTLDVDIERAGQSIAGCTTRESGKSTGSGNAVCTLENGNLNIISGNPKGMHLQFVLAKQKSDAITGPAYMGGSGLPGGRVEIGTASLSDMPRPAAQP